MPMGYHPDSALNRRDVPILFAWHKPLREGLNDLLVVWCPRCIKVHTHGAGTMGGSRARHCRDGTFGFYRLKVVGKWPDDVPHSEPRYLTLGCRCDECKLDRARGMDERNERGRRPKVPGYVHKKPRPFLTEAEFLEVQMGRRTPPQEWTA